MRSNESHKKYNIEKECLLMRSNESHKKESSYYYAQMSHFLSPKLGTTFQQPSWGCAEVLFPPHHGRPIRQLFCNKSNRIDSECLC